MSNPTTPRKPSLSGKVPPRIEIEESSDKTVIARMKQSDTTVTAELSVQSNATLDPKEIRKLRKSNSDLEGERRVPSPQKKAKKEKKSRKGSRDEDKRSSTEYTDESPARDSVLEKESTRRESGSDRQQPTTSERRGSFDEFDENFVIPTSSKTMLEGLLSDFDNQSIWDEELKKVEKKKPATVAPPPSKRSSIAWLFSSTKKEPKESKETKDVKEPTPKEKTTSKGSIRERSPTVAERPSISRSVSVNHISKTNSASNLPFTLPTGPTPDMSNWGPDEIRNYKFEMIKKYEDQEKKRVSDLQKMKDADTSKSQPVLPTSPTPAPPRLSMSTNRASVDIIKRPSSVEIATSPVPVASPPTTPTKPPAPIATRFDPELAGLEEAEIAEKKRTWTAYELPRAPPFLRRRSSSMPSLTEPKISYLRAKARSNFRRGAPRYIDDFLSEETLRKIFEYLHFGDLCRVAQVSKRWTKITSDPNVWKQLYDYYDSKLPPATHDKNIWEDSDVPSLDAQSQPEDINYNDLTLNQLVARLTPYATVPNKTDLNTFLTTYNTFTTPLKLIRKLIQRYHVPERTHASQAEKEQFQKMVVNMIQVRVCSILKLFVEDYFADLNDDVLNILQVFVKGLPPSSRTYVTLSTLLGKKMRPVRKASFPARRLSTSKDVYQSQSTPNLVIQDGKFSILDYKSRVLAEQLTLIEFEFFKNIKPQEFIAEASQSNTNAPSALRRMIDHFNNVSRWTEETILNEPRVKTRALLIEKFVHICKELKELNNFETLQAIISALHSTSIVRLTFTKGAVEPKDMKMLEDLHTLMHADKSYASYRAALQAASPPCILYLGVLIRDMIYFQTPTGELQKGHINFGKQKSVFHMLDFVQKCQSKSYDHLKLVPALHTRLSRLPTRPKDRESQEKYMKDMFELSLKREPRGCKKNEILW